MLIGWSYLIISIPRVCFCFYRIYIKSVLSCWFLRQQISHLVSPTTNIPPAFSANIYKSSLDFVAVHILDTFKEAFKLVDNTFTTNDFSNQFTLKLFILSPNLHNSAQWWWLTGPDDVLFLNGGIIDPLKIQLSG